MLQAFDLKPFYPTDRFDQIGKGFRAAAPSSLVPWRWQATLDQA